MYQLESGYENQGGTASRRRMVSSKQMQRHGSRRVL